MSDIHGKRNALKYTHMRYQVCLREAILETPKYTQTYEKMEKLEY